MAPGMLPMPPSTAGAEGLDAGREAHEEIHLLEDEGVEDAGDAGHRAAEGEGEHHDLVDVDAHQCGGFTVLGDGAHRGAHPGALHDEIQHAHEDERETITSTSTRGT